MSVEPWLVFRVDQVHSAVPVKEVREIVRVPPITRVPGGAHALRGVFNLRGRVLPAFDLAQRLGLATGALGVTSVIVVVETQRAPAGLWGLVVDEVEEVVTFASDAVQPTASLGALPFDARCLAGIARHHDELVFLLELQHVLAGVVAAPAPTPHQERTP